MEETKHLAIRGLVAITATLGGSQWDTLLMPKGDGTQFVPLSANVTKAEEIGVSDRVQLTFALRKRRNKPLRKKAFYEICSIIPFFFGSPTERSHIECRSAMSPQSMLDERGAHEA